MWKPSQFQLTTLIQIYTTGCHSKSYKLNTSVFADDSEPHALLLPPPTERLPANTFTAQPSALSVDSHNQTDIQSFSMAYQTWREALCTMLLWGCQLLSFSIKIYSVKWCLLELYTLVKKVKAENTAVEIRHADHVAPSIRKSWQ
jgi:hypothetical protein